MYFCRVNRKSKEKPTKHRRTMVEIIVDCEFINVTKS